MSQSNQNTEENVIVKVNNQVSNERNLSTSNAVNELIFQNLSILFGASLVFQIMSRLPLSYALRELVLTIAFTIFGVLTMLLYVLKKKPTFKTYLFLISFIIGALLGV